MTITEFLLARIAEDEREASVSLADYEHTTTRRWKRVLAECAAKRAIIGVRNAMAANHPKDGSIGWYQVNCYDTVIKTIAAVYKDHPDYRQEWAL